MTRKLIAAPLPVWADAHLLGEVPAVQAYVSAVHTKIRDGQRRAQGKVFPRYGLLSLHATDAPVLCYSRCALKKVFPLGFHDAEGLFLPDTLCVDLALDAAAGESDGLLPLVLMHFTRQILRHTIRLHGLSDNAAQLAGEISVFSKLRIAFPRLRWSDILTRNIPASRLNADFLRSYSMQAEENIAKAILFDKAHPLHDEAFIAVPTFSRVSASVLLCQDELETNLSVGGTRPGKRL